MFYFSSYAHVLVQLPKAEVKGSSKGEDRGDDADTRLCSRRVFCVSHALIQYRVKNKNYDSARPLLCKHLRRLCAPLLS